MSINKARLREIVEEETRSAVNEMVLQEGVEEIWSKFNHFVAKTIGTWEKGGKIRGRGKRDEAAQEQYMQSMTKLAKVAAKHSAGLIRKLQGDFKKAGYPNQENKHEFLEQTMEMGDFYESLKKAVEGDEMEVVVANELIKQLRIIVKKFLDYDLWDKYKHFMKEVDRDQDELILESIITEARGWEKELARLEKEDEGGDDSDGQEQEEDEGPIGSDKDSTVIGGLKANTLPAVLAAIGAATLLGKWLVDSEWFKEATTRVINRDVSFIEYKEEIVGKLTPQEGEGVTQMLGRVLHGDVSHFGSDANPAEMFGEMKEAGITPQQLSELSDDSGAFLDAWKSAVSGGADTLGEMFPMESLDLSPTDIAEFASSEVGTSVGDFAQYAGELSDADLNTVAARASELAGALEPGVDPPNFTGRSIQTIISNASAHADTNMLGGNPSLVAMNVAMQEFAAGGAPTSIAGAGGPGALGLMLGKSIIMKTLKPVIRAAGESVLKTTVAGKVGAMLSPYLAPLGITLVAAAVGVKALRMKGLHSSRAQVLDDLLQSLDYLDREGNREPVIGGDPGTDPPGTDPPGTDPPGIQPPPPPPPPGVPEFKIPVLIRFDDDDIKYYKLNARYLNKQGNREKAEEALKAMENSTVIGRELQESEAFMQLFELSSDLHEEEAGSLQNTDSFEREFGRGTRADNLKIAIQKTGRRRKLRSGARTKPVFYYVFDKSIQGDLDKLGTGAKFNHFVSRVLRKAIAAVKNKGNKALTPEEAYYAIKRKGGGGTGMKGLSIKEAIEILRAYKVVEGELAQVAKKKTKKTVKKGKKPGKKASAKPHGPVWSPETGKEGEPVKASAAKPRSSGSKLDRRQRQRDRRDQKSAKGFGRMGESVDESIQECRSKASEEKFEKLINGLF
jgi:hypothetical protein